MSDDVPTRTNRVSLVQAADGRGGIRADDLYDTGVDDLWKAVTDPARLARWLGEVQGELCVGGTFHARFVSSWEGPGRVDVCEAPHRLVATMNPGQPDQTVIAATLTTEGRRTRLVIEETGLPVAELPDYGAGWQAHVEDLTAHLEGRAAGDWHARWSELATAYRERV